jgi:hypothetical protein
VERIGKERKIEYCHKFIILSAQGHLITEQYPENNHYPLLRRDLVCMWGGCLQRPASHRFEHVQ